MADGDGARGEVDAHAAAVLQRDVRAAEALALAQEGLGDELLDVAAVRDHVRILVAAVELRARGVALGAGDAAQAEVLLRDGDRLGAEGPSPARRSRRAPRWRRLGFGDAQRRLAGEIGAGGGEGVAGERAEAAADEDVRLAGAGLDRAIAVEEHLELADHGAVLPGLDDADGVAVLVARGGGVGADGREAEGLEAVVAEQAVRVAADDDVDTGELRGDGLVLGVAEVREQDDLVDALARRRSISPWAAPTSSSSRVPGSGREAFCVLAAVVRPTTPMRSPPRSSTTEGRTLSPPSGEPARGARLAESTGVRQSGADQRWSMKVLRPASPESSSWLPTARASKQTRFISAASASPSLRV